MKWIYILKANIVNFNGDCIDVMQKMVDQGIKIDKVITSPPYNIIKPNR